MSYIKASKQMDNMELLYLWVLLDLWAKNSTFVCLTLFEIELICY